MTSFLDEQRQKLSEKITSAQRFLDKNKHGWSSIKAGTASAVGTAAPVLIAYLAKPEEFVNFMADHIGVAISIGIVAAAIVALTMYYAYHRSKKEWKDSEDLSYFLSSTPSSPGVEHDLPTSGALTPTDSSLNCRHPSFIRAS